MAKMVKVVNKKDGRTGVATIGEDRVAIVFDGAAEGVAPVDVAASTFKRWYTVGEEVVAPKQESLQAPKQETPKLEGQASVRLTKWELSGTKGGKCDKVATTIEVDGKILDIVEYNGFITDVRVSKIEKDADPSDPDSYKELYRSPKASLKDTLSWMGYTEDLQASIRKEIVALRKLARNGAQ